MSIESVFLGYETTYENNMESLKNDGFWYSFSMNATSLLTWDNDYSRYLLIALFYKGCKMKTIRIRIIAVLLCIIIVQQLTFAQDKSTEIDKTMKYCYENGQFNGNILVAENGEILYHRAFGIANFDPVDSLQIDHQFRLASVTKQFTAMAIMILKEQGKLNYDDDIRKHLPELPYEDITIRHLLTHTSGVPDYILIFSQYWDIEETDELKKKTANNNDMLAMLIKYPSDVLFKPGEKFQNR